MTSSNEISSAQARSPLWLYITIAILLIPLAVAIYFSTKDSDIDVIAPLDPNCDLQRGPCEAVFPNGSKISLSLEPRPITALTPLHIRVQTEGIDAQSVVVDFRGLNMNMGYNRPQLKAAAAGQYVGSWVLASCGLDRMEWEATVLIQTAKHKMAAPFRLETSGK